MSNLKMDQPRAVVIASGLILLVLLSQLLPLRPMQEASPTTAAPLLTAAPMSDRLAPVFNALDAMCADLPVGPLAARVAEQCTDVVFAVLQAAGAPSADALDDALTDVVDLVGDALSEVDASSLTELTAVLCKVVATFRRIDSSRTPSE